MKKSITTRELVKEKNCNKCKIIKSLDSFHRDRTNKDGYSYVCKNCANKEDRKSYRLNRDKQLQRIKNYQAKNKEKLRLYRNNYYLVKAHTDISYRLARNLRTRLIGALKKNTKTGSAVRDLGCSIPELKQWLEKQFKPGMSWENYGKWHIDHIIPLSSFDLTNEKQVKKASHWFNLQPLWAKDNILKGDKL